MASMNQLPIEKRAAIVRALVEGTSIRAIGRMVGVSKNTVQKLFEDIGAACAAYEDKTLRGLTCQRVQCDEIWAFCQAKEKNVAHHNKGVYGFGDIWTWTAIDPDTKLLVSWYVGLRSTADAQAFMNDLAARVVNLGQISTDGLVAYPFVIRRAFGDRVNYGQIVKLYDYNAPDAPRYSPPKCIALKREAFIGNPDPEHISTSHVERHNLTMRMSIRRFTRLTNAHSKKAENHAASVALHSMHYNFVRINQSIRCTPAMAAKITDRVWEIEDLLNLMDAC